MATMFPQMDVTVMASMLTPMPVNVGSALPNVGYPAPFDEFLTRQAKEAPRHEMWFRYYQRILSGEWPERPDLPGSDIGL